ncbi:amidase [Aminobacter sp. BA135]|uniref:amidase n=1 Tax=Aminobacter sp. BA135 TaxID=537596 RepID=UPI003D78FBD5
MTGFLPRTIAEAAQAIRDGSCSPLELTQTFIQRIRSLDDGINSFVLVDEAGAVDAARRLTDEARNGALRGPLHGIPLAIKDIIDVAGMATTANSHVTSRRLAEHDAPVVRQLRETGAVILGKVVTHEFAYAGPPADLPYGAARNPWDTRRDTGGSSSGSAAAVAAGLCLGALGTDTGGSIRNPVSYCGGVGIKPTWGLVDTSGIIPLAFSLDHCGPIASTVADCAIMLNAMANPDQGPGKDFTSALGQPARNGRIGVLRSFYDYEGGASDEMRAALDAAAETFRHLGCTTVDIQLPDIRDFVACGRIIVLSEAYALHFEDLEATPGRFGRWTRDRVMAGRLLSAKDYIQAQRVRHVLRAAVENAFAQCDVILTASALGQAPLLEEDGNDAYWQTRYPTVAFNLTGHPALAMTCGFSGDGLPLGMQIVGRLGAEPFLFGIAQAYETATAWPNRAPMR